MKTIISRKGTALRRAITVLVSSFCFGTAAFVAVNADDSQIYITKLPEAQTPNVLFALDSSGSMRDNVPGTDQSRMDAVKQALTDLISNTGNMKAGLSRFHPFVGSPIIFPVRDIHKPFGSETANTIVATVNNSSDDAEEYGLTFTSDEPVLELTEIEVPEGGYGTVEPVQGCFMPKDSDDDDEQGTGGSVSIDSPDLDIGGVDAGIRFFDVNIPRNAVILHAEIEFTPRTSSSGSTSTRILGHKAADSSWFVDDPDDPNAVRPRIDNAATGASVSWSNIAEVSIGQEITTPNIRNIIQEIVQDGGWNNGNPLTVLFEAQQGNREFISRDGDSFGDCNDDSVDIPKLRVTYVLEEEAGQFTTRPSADGDEVWESIWTTYPWGGTTRVDPSSLLLVRGEYERCGFFGCNDYIATARTGIRFPDIDIPDGADVVWADIEFTAQSQNDETLHSMRIRGVDEADPAPFNNSNREPSDLNTTFNEVLWEADPVLHGEEIFAPAGAGKFHTPNLAGLVNEIIDLPGFTSGNHMAFLIDHAGEASWSVNAQLACSVTGSQIGVGACPEGPESRPSLRVFYQLPPNMETFDQEVGLRFNEVRIPQGATITSAHLDFVPETSNSEGGTLTIEIENNSSPETFSDSNRISGRAWTGSQSWTIDEWQEDQTVTSVDISDLVDDVTNKNDWCGGQSLAFRITSEGTRLAAKAFESGSGDAPRLRVNYDTSNLQAGEGCTTSQFVAEAKDSSDNVFQEWNRVRNDRGELRLDDQRTVGLRFKDVTIPQGAVINAARLTLTANDDQNDQADITIKAQEHPNPAPFAIGYTSDVTNRLAGSSDIAAVTIDSWNEDQSYTIDLADNAGVLQDIIDGTTTDNENQEWASGNALVLILEGDSDRLDIQQCCSGGDTPPRLTIDYRINLGDVHEPPAKELLLSTIDQIQADGNTPLTDALYEGAAYFAGEPVHFGRTRGAGASYDGNSQNDDDIRSTNINSNWDDNDILDYNGLSTGYANTRLSHPATYGGGATIDRPWNCDEDDPEDYDCRTENITSGNVNYISPFDGAEACERGFLVLLSDGQARDNSSRTLIENLTGAQCSGGGGMDIPRLDSDSGEPMQADGSDSYISRDPTTYEQCGLELSHWLYNKDFIDDGTVDTDVRNNVRTFTIGFNLDLDGIEAEREAVEYLQALAFVGSGGDLNDVDANENLSYGDGFYPANDADQLRIVFEHILDEIDQETTSFVAPGISVNAFNRLFNLDDIYFSLFRPDTASGWKGNLKKFKLCTEIDTGTGTTCEFGEVIDANSVPAVHDDFSDLESYGTLKSDALGFWSEASDSAPEIDEGGAGERIPGFEDRDVYVGLTDPADTEATDLELLMIDRGTHTGDAVPGDEDSFNDIKQALYDNGNCQEGSLSDKNDCLDEMVKWLTGEKFGGDDPRNGEESDVNRWAFGDPMHSRPLVITYGKHVDGDDNVTPLSKIFVGTNDGGFRMINDSGGQSASNDGVEEWIYYPYSLLRNQSDLKENADGTHVYGIDDSPSARINDVDLDGVIEKTDGDFVHVYFGLRRGGQQIYALDVTPASPITGSNLMGEITPTLLWRIDGATTPGFQKLGESWSSPRRARIVLDDGPTTVLIFGGGYSSWEQDGTDGSGDDKYNSNVDGDNVGNAIYIVDATTGELLWWATSDSEATGPIDPVVVPEMNTSIAAPVTPVSTDGDEFADHVYAVDLRGQVFRVDLKTTPGALAAGESQLSASSVGVLAELGDNTEPADRRKFFYAPEVAPVIDQQTGGGTYNLIGLISGNRTNPQGRTVQDRAYGLRDYLWDDQVTASNYPACNPEVCTGQKTGASGASPISHGDGDVDLMNVTDSFVIRNEDGTLEATSDQETALKRSYGWYFDLQGGDVFSQTVGLTGEKGFSGATVLDGKMFFTTFLPPEVDDSGQVLDNACSVAETTGTSRLYAIDFFTGAPVFSHFSGDVDAFEKTDRFRGLGAGPSADLVPAYLPGGTILPVPTGAGAVVQDPDIGEPYKKTFWNEAR